MSEPDSKSRLYDQLRTLQDQVAEATGADAGRLLNQVGDVHYRLGEVRDAMTAYGKAIDEYIKVEQASVARALCTKLVRRFPTVTRAHFTAACLALYQGLKVEAARAVQAYAAAAHGSGTQTMAIPRLRFLAQCVSDDELRGVITRQLKDLGDEESHRFSRESTPPGVGPEGIPKLLLRAAVWDSDALWMSYWLK